MRFHRYINALLILLIASAARAQEATRVYESAQEAYELGHFQKADSLLTGSVNSFKGETRIGVYRLLALCNLNMDKPDVAQSWVSRLLAVDPYYSVYNDAPRFAEMVNHEFYTTLWEGWGHHGIERGTFNHAWSGGGLTCLVQFAAGIEPTSDAFRTFKVCPQMGNLKHIATSFVTYYGTIAADLTQTEPGKIALKLTVPAGTTAEVSGKTYGEGTHEITIQK